MKQHKPKLRYRLGIDVGVASLGLAVLELDDIGCKIHSGYVRTYPIPLGAEERRSKRGMRRNIERDRRRRDRLSELLSQHEIGSLRRDVPKDILDVSPIKARAKASRERVDLSLFSRALLHMATHRGSSAIRELNIKAIDESRMTADGIKRLRQTMQDMNFSTYGQYLRWRQKQNPTLSIRINQTKMADNKDGYAFYPSRELIREEFHTIWDTQATYYPDVLTLELKGKVESELFFQRAITAPPPGNCPYYPEEYRLARSSRLFQIRRIYEAANHLRFYNKSGEAISYSIAQRDMIVDRLMSGECLSKTKIKEAMGLSKSDKVTLQDDAKIAGYPFDIALGADDSLGDIWLNASQDLQDQILTIVTTVHDDDKAIDALLPLLGADADTARRVLATTLPSGWGHMGQTATTKILVELKRDVIPARIAEGRAGLIHASTPDGTIYDRLPYYGEVLQGHTVPPMWVSDYRLDSDKPPQTDVREAKFGRIPNPVVHLALNQIQNAVNDLISRYGVPETIHIELARDLNKSAEARDKETKNNEKNRKANDAAAAKISELGMGISVNRANIQKYKLWQEQGYICIYTGKCIELSALYGSDVDVDHILPRSKTYSDAMANKVVCYRSANADKRNRAPFDAFYGNPTYNWEGILCRVKKLKDKKSWRFQADALQRFTDDADFKARYGTDNAYIARVARQYLSCLYGDPKHVVAVSSHITSLLRGKWGLTRILGTTKNGKKARDDHRHHFIDALVTACATRSMIQRIQTEARRCEKEGLSDFVKSIVPPFGDSKAFYNAARDAVENRVTLSRKVDHGLGGQLHEDTLLGIIDGPDTKGLYVCRVKKKLKDYNKLPALRKTKIQNTLPDRDEINQARKDLECLKVDIESFTKAARAELDGELKEDIAEGKKGKKISENAIYVRAVYLHKEKGGKMTFTVYKNNKLVNIRRAMDGNRPTGGYISGRNHRKDFYLDANGKLAWQLITMLDANDRHFVPEVGKSGNKLLWAVHKEDTLLMDDPDNPARRIRVVVAMISDNKIGVVPDTDARNSKERKIWERGLVFFRDQHAQRINVNAIGEIIWYFPILPTPKNTDE